MSRLEELIQTLCPDGVEFLPLGKLCVSLSKGTLTQDRLNGTFRYPVINSGREYYGRYSKYNNDGNALVIASRGEYAGFISYISEKFWAGGLCYPYRSKNEDKVQTKFIFYVLKNSEQKIMDSLVARGSIPALNKADIDKFPIPLPPLRVQEEIVRILDTFSGVVTELEAEQAARVRQYEHYRDELLSFDSNSKSVENLFADFCLDDVEFIPLEQVLDYSQPTPYIVKSTLYDDSYDMPVLTAGASFILGYTDEKKGVYNASHEKPVIIFDDFTTSFHWVDFNFKVKSSAMKILTQDVQKIAFLRYVFYAMQCIKYQPSQHARQWIQTYSKIKIPIPPIEVQEQIVSILDRFDTLINDLKSGLPAEIALRRKQYEYYRDKLLTFPAKQPPLKRG